MTSTEVDRLIAALARDQRIPAGRIERAEILARLARAKFSDETHKAEDWARFGYDVVGQPHPSRPGETVARETQLTSAEAHTVKRVVEKRWQPGTTTAEYVRDLQAAAGHADANLHVGERPPQGQATERYLAGSTTPLDARGLVVRKVAVEAGRYMLVIYNADKSCLISGYTEPLSGAEKLIKSWTRSRRIAG